VEVGASPLQRVAVTAEQSSISSTTTIGELFDGHSPNSMIHLTSSLEGEFAGGINEGTYFAKLGDVAHLTPLQYKVGVVGPMAGGYGPEANLFLRVSAENSYEFTKSATSVFGYTEYTNPWLVDVDQFLKIPKETLN
jgi:hypothetical protein